MDAEYRNSKKVFFGGVLLLSVSTLLVKLIGLIYKIPMLSFLGSEGMGYFNSAYEIYAIFCIIATAGLPVALSVLISGAATVGDSERVNRIYRSAFRIFFSIGAIGSGAMWIFAKSFCSWIQNENAYACILSIAPTVFFVCISSAVRGYFQGLQRMFPTALSQLMESVGKLVFGLIFASVALRNGQPAEFVAAAAGWGLSLGTALSTVYLILTKHRFSKSTDILIRMREENGKREGESFFRPLLALALPMTLGASLTSITKLIDTAMILRGLQRIGYTESAANAAYGSYTTLAISVFSLLPTLLNSVSLPLVPVLSSAIASKNDTRQRQMIETSYKLTAFFSIPASFGIAIFSKPILSLIFKNQEQSVAIAAPLLSLLGASVFLSCMITATNSVLHAYKVVKRPIFSLAIGALVKIVVAYFLIGNPEIGILGAPISSFCCNISVVAMNFFFASRFSKSISVGKIFMLPLLNSALSIGFSFLFFRYFEEKYYTGDFLTILTLFLSVVLYFFLSFASGMIGVEDIRSFPAGERLYRSFIHIKSRIFKENQQKTDR